MKRAVILMGAGAAIPFGGKTTSEITDTICSENRFTTKSGVPIFLAMRKYLAELYKVDINRIDFERIFHFIMYLQEIYFTKRRNLPSLTSHSIYALEKIDHEIYDDFFHYEILNRNNEGVIAKFHDGIDYKRTQDPDSVLINNYRKSFLNRLSRCCDYAFPASLQNTIYRKQFYKYLNHLNNNGFVLRIYTLNYDNLVPDVFEEHQGYRIFNGFNESGYTSDQFDHKLYDYNVSEIIEKNDINSYFNLHGSFYWFFERSNNLININDKIVFCKDPIKEPSEMIYGMSNPNNPIYYNTIITGYDKLQRMVLEPIKAMNNSFYLDCLNANSITTIGFSFNDPHIASILENTYSNKKPKFLHIGLEDPKDGFSHGELFSLGKITNAHFNRKDFLPNERTYTTKNGEFTVFRNGFDEFLNDEINWGL